MSTNEFPMNERNLNGAVSVIRSISKWPPGAVKTINDKLGETLPKNNDLRLIRRIILEELKANSQQANLFLDIQAQIHQKEIEKYKKEIEQYKEFIDFCKNDDEYKVILDEFNMYLQRKAAVRSASAPPVLSKKSLMRRYKIKY